MSFESLYELSRICLIAFSFTGAAEAATLTFDDLPDPYYNTIPNGYGGLQWDNFNYLNTVYNTGLYGSNGYTFGTISGPRVALNAYGTPASIMSATPFRLNSAYVTGAFNDGLQVEVEGFVGNTLTYDRTYTVNSTAASLIVFDYAGVNQVTFTSFGGIEHGYPNGGGVQFVMDNLTINAVPEPSGWMLVGLGVASLALFRDTPPQLRNCTRRADDGHRGPYLARTHFKAAGSPKSTRWSI